jgi:cholesterol transport system auxiliary component
MTRLFARRAVLLGAAGLAGCSVLPERTYQERREWPLEVPPPAPIPAHPGAPVLLLRSLRAGPGLDTRGLRTKLPDGAEHLDYWEEWAVPPPQGVETALRQYLAASGLFSAVVMPGSELAPDLVLEGELLGFVADESTRVARADLSLVLLRAPRYGRLTPLLQHTVSGEAPLSGTDGPAVAASLRAALAALLGAAVGALGPFVRG